MSMNNLITRNKMWKSTLQINVVIEVRAHCISGSTRWRFDRVVVQSTQSNLLGNGDAHVYNVSKRSKEDVSAHLFEKLPFHSK